MAKKISRRRQGRGGATGTKPSCIDEREGSVTESKVASRAGKLPGVSQPKAVGGVEKEREKPRTPTFSGMPETVRKNLYVAKNGR